MSRMNKDIKNMPKDEMEKYREKDRQQEAGICIVGEARKDREEVTPIELQEEAERTVKNLESRLAESLEVNEAHQKINGKLQMRIIELEQDNLELHADNKKIAHQLDDRIDQMRKSGL